MANIVVRSDETKKKLDLWYSDENLGASYLFMWQGKRYILSTEKSQSDRVADVALGVCDSEEIVSKLRLKRVQSSSKPFLYFKRNIKVIREALKVIDSSKNEKLARALFEVLGEANIRSSGNLALLDTLQHEEGTDL